MNEPPIRKFMFDRSFDAAAVVGRAPERKPVTLKPEQFDQLKQESYDAGVAAGRAAAQEEQDKRTSALFARIESALESAVVAVQPLRQEQEHSARALALAVVRKLLPDLSARHGLQEIHAVLNDAISEALHEPRLVVRIHESQFDIVNAKIHEITVQKAYAGKAVVLADAEIAVGDCKIEWADGGIERNMQASWSDIQNTVAPGTTDNSTI